MSGCFGFYGADDGTCSRLRARSGSALTVHRTVIHYLAIQVPIETKKEKHQKVFLFFGADDGTCSRLRARSGSALTVHRTVIHYLAIQVPIETKKRNTRRCFSFLELMMGLEPTTYALPRRCATDCATSANNIARLLYHKYQAMSINHLVFIHSAALLIFLSAATGTRIVIPYFFLSDRR